MNELKVFVERCVRPVIREESAKLQMREELYDHVMSAYQQELERAGNDEQLALEQTLKRMGDSKELTRELQDSVGTLDRWSGYIDAIMLRPVRMPLPSYALRATLWFGGPFIVGLLLTLVFRLPELLAREVWALDELRFVGSLGGVWITNEFFCLMFFGKACEIALHAEWTFNHTVKIVMLAAGTALAVLLAGWLFTLLTTGSADIAYLLPYWALLACSVGLGMIVVPWLTRVQLKGLREWRELEIEG